MVIAATFADILESEKAVVSLFPAIPTIYRTDNAAVTPPGKHGTVRGKVRG